jgi:hypothetical protein
MFLVAADKFSLSIAYSTLRRITEPTNIRGVDDTAGKGEKIQYKDKPHSPD